MKKIKTVEEYLDRFETEIEDGGDAGMFKWLINTRYEEVASIIKQAQLDMLEYAVNKCAFNSEVDIVDHEELNINSLPGIERGANEVILPIYGVDEQSILKTIDEIKKELESKE